MMAVLRVWGAAFDVGAFLASHPQFSPDSVRRAGEKGVLGRVVQNSGFNQCLSERDEWPDVLSEALAHLRTIRAALLDAAAAGARMELDFAIDAGAGDAAYGSAWFSPAELGSLVDSGVELRITAYPVSEGGENPS
jgi:hypothetical protein